ncbi:MAG: FAD binding domain-containing protein [Caldilineales bacterium]|nr:FAD binding domain-containing protein [Caldilineales bacterium]MCW5858264.1 FAD binding domain-containing protein [Caldilineales bacterium]
MSIQTYFQPRSLAEATSLLAEHGPSLLIMAGGTVVMPLINDGVSTPEKVMGLRQAGLSYVRREDGVVRIGATTPLTQMLDLAAIPLLQEAARHTATWTIRNMGTAGGNLFVPPPAGDFAVALLALNAQVKLARAGGERIVPLASFWSGFMQTALAADELLAEIMVPVPAGRTAFVKYGRKHANTPAIVTVAAHVVLNGGRVQQARLALGAAGPHPIRARKAEASLEGREMSDTSIAAAAALAAEESEPFTDGVASEWYRRRMVKVQVGRALSQISQ